MTRQTQTPAATLCIATARFKHNALKMQRYVAPTEYLQHGWLDDCIPKSA